MSSTWCVVCVTLCVGHVCGAPGDWPAATGVMEVFVRVCGALVTQWVEESDACSAAQQVAQSALARYLDVFGSFIIQALCF